MKYTIHMDKITTICYSTDLVQLFEGTKFPKGHVTPLNSLKIESTGEYEYTRFDRTTGTPTMFMGSAPADCFQEIATLLPDSLFDEKRAREMEQRYVSKDSRWANRFFLQKYQGPSLVASVILVVDSCKFVDAIPKDVLHMQFYMRCILDSLTGSGASQAE